MRADIFKERHNWVLLLIILITTFFSFLWVYQDAQPQPFTDPYPLKTFQFIEALSETNATEIFGLISNMAVGSRPPLYQLLTVPAIIFIERSIDGMLFVNVIANVVLAAAVFQLGKLLKDNRTGLLAALLILTFPTITNLMKMARPHAVAPAATAVSLWILFSLLQNKSVKNAWLLGFSLAVSFWIHPNLLYVLPVATTVVVFYVLFFQPSSNAVGNQKLKFGRILAQLRDPFVIKGLLPAAVVALFLTAIWYVPKFQDLSSLVAKSATDWSTVRYGYQNLPHSFWWYAQTMPGAISNFFTVLLVSGLVIGLMKRKLYPVMVSLVFVLMYGSIGFRVGALAWMNGAVILPLTAVLIAFFVVEAGDFILDKTKSGWLKAAPANIAAKLLVAFVYLMVIVQAALNYSIVNWAVPEVKEQTASLLGMPLRSACGWRMVVSFCPDPPRAENWQMEEILKAVIELESCPGPTCELAIVSESGGNISYSNFTYHLIRAFPDSGLLISPIRSGNNYYISWLTDEYLFFIPELENHSYSDAVKRLLVEYSAGESPDYQEVARFSLPRKWTGILLKRVTPLDFAGAVQLVDELNVTPEEKARLLEEVDLEFSQ